LEGRWHSEKILEYVLIYGYFILEVADLKQVTLSTTKRGCLRVANGRKHAFFIDWQLI